MFYLKYIYQKAQLGIKMNSVLYSVTLFILTANQALWRNSCTTQKAYWKAIKQDLDEAIVMLVGDLAEGPCRRNRHLLSVGTLLTQQVD